MKLLGSAAVVMTAVLSMSCLGCGDAETAPVSQGSLGEAEGSDSKEESSDPAEISVSVGDRAAFDELLATHEGKIVLVDFWATWCPPCVEEFPHTVEVSKKSDPSKLAVISVSMDEPDDKEKVLTFLKEKAATFDNLISKYGVGQEGFEAFEITDGAVPHYKVYDGTGKLRHTASSNDEIDQLIEQLLNEE